MEERHLHALTRFFDGEPVEPSLLLESLSNPDASDYLQQWASLRAWVRQDESRPSPRFYSTMADLLKRPAHRWWIWSRMGTGVAASLIVAAALGGLVVGKHMGRTPAGQTPAAQSTARAATSGGIPVSAAAEETGASSHEPFHSAIQPKVAVGAEWPPSNPRLRFDTWREVRLGGEN
jgi:hypothetical protein